MEGRPPFDPDEDLDFDFESSRRKRYERETGERPALGDTGSEPEADDDGDAPDTGEQQRRERPSSASMKLPGLGAARRRRRNRKRDRDRDRDRDRPARAAAAASTDTGEQRRLRDDPYTPAEVPVPGSRRERHRDLPAQVRRRQVIAIGVVALVLLGGLYALASSIFGGDEDEGPTPAKKLIGQTVIGKLGKGTPDNKLLRRVRKGQVGGFIVEPRDAEALSLQTEALNAAAEEGDNPPLLFVIDQEGGDVKRLPGPPTVSPQEPGRERRPGRGRVAGGGDGDVPARARRQRRPGARDGRLVPGDRGLDRRQDLRRGPGGRLGRRFRVHRGTRVPGRGRYRQALPRARPGDGQHGRRDGRDSGHPGGPGRGPDPVPGRGGCRRGPGDDVLGVLSGARLRPAGRVRRSPSSRACCAKTSASTGSIISDDLESAAISAQADAAGTEAVSAFGAGVDLLLYASTAKGSVTGFNAIVEAFKADTITREQLEETTGRIADLKSSLGG